MGALPGQGASKANTFLYVNIPDFSKATTEQGLKARYLTWFSNLDFICSHSFCKQFSSEPPDDARCGYKHICDATAKSLQEHITT